MLAWPRIQEFLIFADQCSGRTSLTGPVYHINTRTLEVTRDLCALLCARVCVCVCVCVTANTEGFVFTLTGRKGD